MDNEDLIVTIAELKETIESLTDIIDLLFQIEHARFHQNAEIFNCQNLNETLKNIYEAEEPN